MVACHLPLYAMFINKYDLGHVLSSNWVWFSPNVVSNSLPSGRLRLLVGVMSDYMLTSRLKPLLGLSPRIMKRIK